MAGPLSGIRVIDVTTVLLEPYGAQFSATWAPKSSRSRLPTGDVAHNMGTVRDPGMGGIYLHDRPSTGSPCWLTGQVRPRSIALSRGGVPG